MRIEGARALVTGGSEGIGFGIAQALAAKGARVAIMARQDGRLREAAARLGAVPIRGDGLSECWRAELRPHDVRVILVSPSEVQTGFFAKLGEAARPENPRKLRPDEIAHAVVAALEMDDRGFIPEFSVWATNPF